MKKIPNEIQLPELIAHYPAEAHEDVVWLRTYLSRRCNDDVQTLMKHATAKGFNNDYNYFYQVLTGRYFRTDAAGKVQGSVKNLLKLCEQLKVYDTFANTLAKLRFVETSSFRQINEYVQRKSTAFNACRFGGIIGHTGSGKSAAFKEIVRRERPGLVIHMESPADASLSQFIHKLGFLFGGKHHDGLATKRTRIREKLHEGHILIIDNVQRCYDARKGSHQPIFSYLQEVQDDTNCTVILSWTPVAEFFEEALSNAYFEQFVGRIGGEREILRLSDYTSDEDIELIAASFTLSEADIEELMPRLRALVREKGRVRSLFNALQRGNRRANLKKEQFTAKHLLQALGE